MLLGELTSAEADPTGEINPGARIDYRERNADSGVGRRIHAPAPSLQTMIRRWTALGVVTAEKKFRRIKGYRQPDRIREDALRILAPFRLRRRGVETKLVLGNPTKSVDRTLLRNIANALSWLGPNQSKQNL